jgi:uncharacterized protein (TIGR03086 family)
MSDVTDRYQRLAAAFAGKIEGVPPQRWHDPTPCAEWDVHDLVRHVVEMNEMYLDLVGRRLRGGPSVYEDPLGAFLAVRDRTRADLDDPELAEAEFDGPLGRWTFAQAIDRMVCVELIVHGWDLARATGQDERIDPAEVARLTEALDEIGEDVIRDPTVCGPAVDAPPDADDQARLLAYLGREV